MFMVNDSQETKRKISTWGKLRECSGKQGQRIYEEILLNEI